MNFFALAKFFLYGINLAPTYMRRCVVVIASASRATRSSCVCSLRSIYYSRGGVEQRRNMPSSDSVNNDTVEPQVELQFAKLSENAFAPTRGSEQAAGFDLRSAYDYTVAASGKAVVLTDIQIAVPSGCYGRVAPRSGLAVKNFIDVGAGVIDQDYRGNVGIVLFNFGKEDFKVSRGDRVAQLILERIYIPKLVELKSLDDTNRGTGGFGSTGHN